MKNSVVRFTLDTNCLVDVDETRPAAGDVLALIEAGRRGEADVAMLASSASERQPGGGHLEKFTDFQARMIDLGLSDIALLKPLAKWNLSFYGFAFMADEASLEREELIFRTLFPTTPYKWADFAHANGLDQGDLTSRDAWKWRNRLCDAQAFWSHLNDERDVFVTSDKNFGRLSEAAEFAGVVIMTPSEAAALLKRS